MNYNYFLFLNYYLFSNNFFFNKIFYEKIFYKDFFKNNYNILKKIIFRFNPFYGIKINSFNLIINIFFKKKNIFLIKKYKISYKDLTKIFNFSIEKIRIKNKKKCLKFVY